MTGKRDKKGRVLRQGERQREDGRYEYRYKDAHGETRSVYSWRLVESDSTPKGKKNGKPLRELEKGIIRDLEDNVNSYTAYRTTFMMPTSKPSTNSNSQHGQTTSICTESTSAMR